MYLSTDTIEKVYRELSSYQYKNQSIIHIFLILKAIRINDIDYVDVEKIKSDGFPFAYELGYLFSPIEKSSDKCDFINPFYMAEWGNNPTELLAKWVASRVKNNIIGGATTWRKIILQTDDNAIKFRHDYVSTLNELTIESAKYNLLLLSIWVNRFTFFERKVTISELINNFTERYKLNELEKNTLFSSSTKLNNIEFSNEIHDASKIRQLIGAPDGMQNWIFSKHSPGETINIDFAKTRRYSITMNQNPTVELIRELISDYQQVIFSGPPGTSKSFYSNKIGQNYDEVVNIQFHPQYSYQQFVGGYIVKGTNVLFEKGLFINLIEKALKETNKKFLLIIDEINRANLSQVFGEIINCLDRDNETIITIDNTQKKYKIPANIHIVGTMNTTDRTLGSIDFALKRRFLNIYFNSTPELLIDLCYPVESISLSDFLRKINSNLLSVTQNRDFSIGHAYFLNKSYSDSNGKFRWDIKKLSNLFYYKILPIIEDYCHNDSELIKGVVGEKLVHKLDNTEFKSAIQEFIS